LRCSFGLGDAEDFLDGGEAAPDFGPAVGAQGAHALFHGALGDGGGGAAIQDERADGLVEDQEFVDPHAALVAELAAILAPGAAQEAGGVDLGFGEADLAEVIGSTFCSRLQEGQMVRTRRWAMTASTEEATRKGSMPMSIRRVKALGASLVCSVLKTRWPVRAARMAISAVSRSRISPTMMTFGSWRRIWRRPTAKVRPISGRTAIWLMPLSSYSTGSSMVMMRLWTELMELRKA
jgi:hypothetical protein